MLAPGDRSGPPHPNESIYLRCSGSALVLGSANIHAAEQMQVVHLRLAIRRHVSRKLRLQRGGTVTDALPNPIERSN